ncbi:AbrB/MazE/SpoVT family DNA-binding domain-containing protein [Prosthecobacter sp.]
MKTQTLLLKRIGRSQAVCLPAAVIRRHHFKTGLILEDRGHEVVLRSLKPQTKLSWPATYRAMAAAKEDWSEWDAAAFDGGEEVHDGSYLPPPLAAKPRRTRK